MLHLLVTLLKTFYFAIFCNNGIALYSNNKNSQEIRN